MRWPTHKAGMMLEHNPHKSIYQKAESWVRQSLFTESHDWVSKAAQKQAIETDEIWTLYWEPKTPVGSYAIAAPTLKELLEFANTMEDA